jgi:hypothetical protein
MKFSLAIAATMAATTMASPTWGKHWSEKWGEKWGNDKDQSTSSSHRSIDRLIRTSPLTTILVSKKSPFDFTSTYKIEATPDQVVDANNTYTGGLKGAYGIYKFGINSKENVICYNITITGFQGEYQSPAISATHIHEAVKGKAGPPRIAFPNPVEVCPGVRRSIGCITGTKDGFVTGVKNTATGQDQGFGFNVKKIEDNPKGFFADVHSSKAVPGAVRGQLA